MAITLRVVTDTPNALPSEQALLERAVAGRYRVLDLVSRGGMGAVYRGWENGLERHVALKLLAPTRAADPDERGRFRREARILASLTHPGIIPTLGIGESGEACWFAMPFVPGGTLARRMDQAGRLEHDEVRRVLIRLADALDYAHSRGVIHRDLKAENILLDDAGRPVLTDFGVAIVNSSDHSRAEITKGYGTPQYMSPEQLLGAVECDGRQDIYALGVLGFRMLTGRFPFEGTADQIRAAHVTRDVPNVAAHAANVPPDLAAAIDKCLAKKAKHRWTNGAELRSALQHHQVRSIFPALRRLSTKVASLVL